MYENDIQNSLIKILLLSIALVGKSLYLIYYNRKSIDESEKILAVRSKQSNNGQKVDSVSDFIQNNKEICLKNFIGELLRVEKEKIEYKRVEIQKILEGSARKLDNDYKAFMGYIDKEKETAKTNDEVVNIFKFRYFNK